MATIILSTIGTIVGGPIGGAIGSLVGQQLDAAIFAPKALQGPRLKELDVQTSSYGRPVPAIFGKMRVAGTVIWSSDLVERRQKSGGGKGKPKTVTYSYSSSFAVAISSRQAQRVARIWADGNLIRNGAGGALTCGGQVRFYDGAAHQMPDPLIEQSEGIGSVPAYRGIAYCVFEDLQLADFGNRIPSLTFELVADDNLVSVADVASHFSPALAVAQGAQQLIGYVTDADNIADHLAPLLPIDRMLLKESDGNFALIIPDAAQVRDITSPPVLSINGRMVENADGLEIEADPSLPLVELRYYDPERDYQISSQASSVDRGQAALNRQDLPAVLAATDAAHIAFRLADAWRDDSYRQSYCVAEEGNLDLAIGDVVRLDMDESALLINDIERIDGALSLSCSPYRASLSFDGQGAQSSFIGSAALNVGETLLDIFNLPVGFGELAGRSGLMVAASGKQAGWRGADVSVLSGGAYQSVGVIGTGARMGILSAPLLPANPFLWDRNSSLQIAVADPAISFAAADDAQLLNGANLLHLNGEFLQFGQAEQISAQVWRLSSLMRGLFASEKSAAVEKPVGSAVTVVEQDMPSHFWDSANLAHGSTVSISVEGLGDVAPIISQKTVSNQALRPWPPVAKGWERTGSVITVKTARRPRIHTHWQDYIDMPLVESTSLFQATQMNGYGQQLGSWQSNEPDIPIPIPQISLTGETSVSFELRQIGDFGASDTSLVQVPAAALAE